MKFMKLGFKPDTFESDGHFHKYAVSDLDSDVTVNVGEFTFYLHKFPLLSKSNRMQRLFLQANEERTNEITIIDIPGGHKAFEICAKFCYGMTVTLNAYNITAVRCAAEYLEMTEDVDRGNLIYKVEVFLNSCIFRSWKDSIIMLKTTQSLLPWSEDLNLVGRCIDSVSGKILVSPEMITWSYTHNKKLSEVENWWLEDVCELEVDMFKQVMSVVKSSGSMKNEVIGEALRYYVSRWLQESMLEASSNKDLVETVVYLLPKVNRVMTYSTCSFLMKLLKISNLVGANEMVREDLVVSVSLKLHEASLKDLLMLEVELVHSIVKRVSQVTHLGHESLLKIGRLIDAYLASKCDITLSRFIELSELVVDEARPNHDGLYKAIDSFLKEHNELTKSEKKRLCGLMDVKKLTSEASMHAAQNERLPLRVVVQVLYFEQFERCSTAPLARANRRPCSSHSPVGSVVVTQESIEMKKVGMSKISRGSKSMRSGGGGGGAKLMGSRSRRVLEKIWLWRGESNKSSEVSSGSSLSPPVKSSRCQRHSIS